jgi:GNAT superfamily N-acetyltransferase
MASHHTTAEPIEVSPTDPRVTAVLARDAAGTASIAGRIDSAVARLKDDADADAGGRGPARAWIDDAEAARAVLFRHGGCSLHAETAAALDVVARALPGPDERGGHDLWIAAVSGWIRDRLAQTHPVTFDEPCLHFDVTPDELDRSAADPGLPSLTGDHAELATEHNPYISDVELMRQLIESAPSVYVPGPGGSPVSWALVKDDGQMGAMFTLPEARRKGYARIITATLADRLLRAGRRAFLYTIAANAPAQALARAVGFRCRRHCSWTAFGDPDRSAAG